MVMLIRKRIAATIALVGGVALAAGVTLSAQAATPSALRAVQAEPGYVRTPLPPATRACTGTDIFTIDGSQAPRCAGTLKYVSFHGTGVAGQYVTITYMLIPGTPSLFKRGVAGIASVDEDGNWRMDAKFPKILITQNPDAGKIEVAYHAIEVDTSTSLVEKARYEGVIPIPVSFDSANHA
ncbi:hypothetical protein O159_15890 [Leifsonia xyli subsp. cynodontis DSM 46306]|uniref:Secreted protein n=1 Tax=Leifsonia xyli subsp. cynodontis DSM 46306 TaxID=1389489 RepID=U3PDK7_LEIXC|nr:hypothetical protein [Leifsonia xyli]AGW41638.1 hypothetical protein O159_15890 [Leifsonia xyli subsp. cynodontis DSM 46306]